MLNNDSYILTRYVRLSLSILSLLFGSAYNVNHNINNGFFKQTKKNNKLNTINTMMPRVRQNGFSQGFH